LNVLLLSWEYPPRIIGGLGTHVHQLAVNLARLGLNVHVVTKDAPGAPDYEHTDDVHIHRVPLYPPEIPQDEWVPWTLQFNVALLERAVPIINERMGKVHVLHAHDWLVAHAAIALKHAYRIPLVATIHATERGRHHGLHNPQQTYINDVEWHLTYEAWRVIVCSDYMRSQVVEAFQVPADKIRVIPNGIDPLDLAVNEAAPVDRNQYAHPTEKIVFFVGRLVREKGAQVLVEAMPAILQAYHATKFLVAGSGPMEEELRRRAGNWVSPTACILPATWTTPPATGFTGTPRWRWLPACTSPSVTWPWRPWPPAPRWWPATRAGWGRLSSTGRTASRPCPGMPSRWRPTWFAS